MFLSVWRNYILRLCLWIISLLWAGFHYFIIRIYCAHAYHCQSYGGPLALLYWLPCYICYQRLVATITLHEVEELKKNTDLPDCLIYLSYVYIDGVNIGNSESASEIGRHPGLTERGRHHLIVKGLGGEEGNQKCKGHRRKTFLAIFYAFLARILCKYYEILSSEDKKERKRKARPKSRTRIT